MPSNYESSFNSAVHIVDLALSYSTEPYTQAVSESVLPLLSTFTYTLEHFEQSTIEGYIDEVELDSIITSSLYTMPGASIVDKFLLSDIFTQRSVEKPKYNIESGIGLMDIVAYHATERFERTYESNIINISSMFSSYATNRYNYSLETVVSISDMTIYIYKDNPEVSHENIVVLHDEISFYKTHTYSVILDGADDSLQISSELEAVVSLTIIGGIGSGFYSRGESVPISVTLKNDEHFAAWIGDISGVLSVTAKFTNVVIGSTGFKPIKITAIKDRVPRGFTLSGDVMSSAIVDVTMQQGSTFKRNVYYKDSNGDPIDLTGYTAAMQIRKSKASIDTEVDISTSQGDIIINGPLGFLEVHIAASVMDALDFDYGYYDLELYPEGDVGQAFRILEGRVKLVRQVTR